VTGVIGAGNFTTGILLPAIEKTQALLKTIASRGGTSAAIAARKYDFEQATSDYHTILEDLAVTTVVITTPHNSHARMVIEVLKAGKHTFVEKPLALNRSELNAIGRAVQNTEGQLVLVGYNRRFAALAVKMKALHEARSKPMSLIYTVNTGVIPATTGCRTCRWAGDASSVKPATLSTCCVF
jgi:predicted dehydrogenase